jgi:FkbM family methyltransferase
MIAAQSAWGAYSPNIIQYFLIRIARAMPGSWLGRRVAYFLRRLMILWVGERALDVETFGLRLRFYGHDNVAEKRLIYTPQFFDREEREIIANSLPESGVFVDVGANAGGYSFYVASQHPAATILAVEPQPEMLVRLNYNVAQNQLNNVRVMPVALSSSAGEMTLHTYAHNRGEASLKHGMDNHHATGSVQVQVMTLFGMLAANDIAQVDVMKLDAEGAEDSILAPFFAEAPATLFPRMIVLEYVPSRWDQDLRALLESNGYHLHRQTQLNAVFVRN